MTIEEMLELMETTSKDMQLSIGALSVIILAEVHDNELKQYTELNSSSGPESVAVNLCRNFVNRRDTKIKRIAWDEAYGKED